ncbi:hypothetical protein [Haliovirga abyssi]|uniref:Uncharacterized protein n=1 Tax=Haliovirga abyssi TaxID=2996794 RepID=A0AAU9DKP6_9FUSO|nr:hypothetical protein [Haliovirga abyssi]BDU50472.1 hypothetical protein HLVA_10410 [Haliovirga abyssi]
MFYERFKEKIKKYDLKEKKIYKYGINFRRKFIWFISGFNLLFVGLFFFYQNLKLKDNFQFLMSGFFIFVGGVFIYMMMEYKISIDIVNEKLKYKKMEIELKDIEKITLRRMVPTGGKNIEKCIDIITKEKKQYIIPLIMSKSVEFVAVLRKKYSKKFSME